MLPFLCLGAWLDGGYVIKSSGFCDLRCEAEQFTRNQLRYIIPHTQGEGFTCQPSSTWETHLFNKGGSWKSSSS